MTIAMRIIAGVSGSPRNLAALRYAAALAYHHDAALLPVHVWVPPGGELVNRRFPEPHLRREWEDAAWRRLRDALERAFGGASTDLCVDPVILQAEPRQALVATASGPGDLLVIGTGRRGPVRHLWHGAVGRYCLANAKCPVIAIPPPALELTARPKLPSWASRHKNLDPWEEAPGRARL